MCAVSRVLRFCSSATPTVERAEVKGAIVVRSVSYFGAHTLVTFNIRLE